jgi:hypothetical protein
MRQGDKKKKKKIRLADQDTWRENSSGSATAGKQSNVIVGCKRPPGLQVTKRKRATVCRRRSTSPLLGVAILSLQRAQMHRAFTALIIKLAMTGSDGGAAGVLWPDRLLGSLAACHPSIRDPGERAWPFKHLSAPMAIGVLLQ